MDAFYASVEQRDDPSLAGRPVIVGGTGRRGVVCAASYPAREFGVHSAMPVAKARRLCPDGVYLRPRMDHYQAVSKDVFSVFREFTPEVEGLSLDEAFLDVSSSRKLLGSMTDIGWSIKRRMREKTGLTASVGMARNKFLAKFASDYGKPDGHFAIEPEDVRRVFDPLPVRRLWGIGKKAGERLNDAGLHTIGQLRRAPTEQLDRLLGNRREHFLRLANGVDDRPIVCYREEKSVSQERTFGEDIANRRDCHRVLMQLSEAVGRRLRSKALVGTTIQVKIRRADFKTYTRQRAIAEPTDGDQMIYDTAKRLFDRWWREQSGAPVRLLGVGLSEFGHLPAEGDLFAAQEKPPVDGLLDDIRSRFGSGAVTRARTLGDKQ